MQRQIIIAVGCLLMLSALNAAASDTAKGKALVAERCTGCHDDRVYTRPNRIVHSLRDLHGRVKFCDSAANAGFSEQDIDDVVGYLNHTYYKFPDAP